MAPREHDGVTDADLREGLRQLVQRRGYERREEAFVLSSGGTSHDYVDLRRAVASGDDLALAARAVLHALTDAGISFDVIGGLTMGADPVSHAVALLSGKGWFSVRKAAKEHGRGRRIEGSELGPGVRAVVFEDTVSTGRSMIDALGAVVETGSDVVALCTLLDRGDELARSLAERGVAAPLLRLLSYRDLGIAPLGE